jgi:hypothetical protein
MAYDKDNKGSSDAARKISKRFKRKKKKEDDEPSWIDNLKESMSKGGARERYNKKKKKK